MFGSETQKNSLPLIIVCDDKDMVYANYPVSYTHLTLPTT